MEAILGELNHLSTPGEENKNDSESSGERNRRSLNPATAGGCRAACPQGEELRENFSIAERFWESLLQRVKAPYAKWWRLLGGT